MGNNASGIYRVRQDGIAACNRHAVQSFQYWVEEELPALLFDLGKYISEEGAYSVLADVLKAVRGETDMVTREDLIAVFYSISIADIQDIN